MHSNLNAIAVVLGRSQLWKSPLVPPLIDSVLDLLDIVLESVSTAFKKQVNFLVPAESLATENPNDALCGRYS